VEKLRMSFSGRLEEFSLPEILKVIAEGRKSGLLSLRVFEPDSASFVKYYIWTIRGEVAGMSQNLHGRDLINWLCQQDLLNHEQKSALQWTGNNLGSSSNLGDYLLQRQYLNRDQLQQIFRTRVIVPIHHLFKLNEGFFTFNAGYALPISEMTGFTISAYKLNFKGLIRLENWDNLATKLPEAEASLLKVNIIEPTIAKILQEYPIEQQILQYADGRISIGNICKTLGESLAVVQQAAFRLIMIGLVEELPMVIHDQPASLRRTSPDGVRPSDGLATYPLTSPLTSPLAAPVSPAAKSSAQNLSTNFLGTLTSFLASRINGEKPMPSVPSTTPATLATPAFESAEASS
jgi:hypothetical protein